jgi:hypothetical protein
VVRKSLYKFASEDGSSDTPAEANKLSNMGWVPIFNEYH